MTKELLLIFAERWRSLLGFALLFRILENLFFAPLIAMAIHWLVGRTVLDSTALVSFLLSPRGLLVIMLASVTALTIRLTEHAGLSAIFFSACEGRTFTARQALRLVRLHLLEEHRLHHPPPAHHQPEQANARRERNHADHNCRHEERGRMHFEVVVDVVPWQEPPCESGRHSQ